MREKNLHFSIYLFINVVSFNEYKCVMQKWLVLNLDLFISYGDQYRVRNLEFDHCTVMPPMKSF